MKVWGLPFSWSRLYFSQYQLRLKDMSEFTMKEQLNILIGKVTRETTPYVYMLIDKETKIAYIGSRCAKGCHPNELGVTYFTTSRIVNPIFKQNPSSFIKKLVYIGEDAVEFESMILNLFDAKNSDHFYNLQNGHGDFNGRKAALITVVNKLGVHARSKDQMSIDANKMVEIHRVAKTGIFALGVAAKGRATQEKLGIAAYSREARSKGGITSGNMAKELKTGIHAFSKEKRSEVAKLMHKTRYKCGECNLVGPATSIALHQKAKHHTGRIKLDNENE